MTSRTRLAIAAAIFLAGMQIAHAGEPTTIKVTLSDQAGKDMHIALSQDKTRAGPVEFKVTNTSTSLVHELLITPWRGASKNLPYDAKVSAVAEGNLLRLEGIEDMDPGMSATIRLVLRPGKYVVFCNQAGHYKMGMVQPFTVTN